MIYKFEKRIVGKNHHTVYEKCPNCNMMGVNLPLDKVCGNCGYEGTITYYDAKTINDIVNESFWSKVKRFFGIKK